MPMFHTSYRWRSPKCVWENFTHYYYQFTIGIANIFRWIPVIWDDVDWDYSALLHIMEYKFRRMAKAQEDGHLLDRHRHAKQLRICAALVKRIREDKYYDTARRIYPENGKYRSAHSIKLQEQDKQYLGLLIGKYLDHWWD